MFGGDDLPKESPWFNEILNTSFGEEKAKTIEKPKVVEKVIEQPPKVPQNPVIK